MKRLWLLFLMFLSFGAQAQDEDIAHAFDFWVGTWEAKWTNKKGETIYGENVVSKTAGGKVILENFSDTTNQFFGTSISVFSPVDSSWHQAWADNSGGYIDLIGVVEGDIRIFQTKAVKYGDRTIVRRMIFYNIQPDSFTWDWEVSTDGGKTWKLAWQIVYTRKT
ncbi:MAG: hypothetical protein HUJ25_11575 [Crocinitomicaceae bacterium]|nr:hypothetical protein [Crocinitomicaceae bacterium]